MARIAYAIRRDGEGWSLTGEGTPAAISYVTRDVEGLIATFGDISGNGSRALAVSRSGESAMPQDAPPVRRKKKWSAEVAAHSDALDLEEGVFTKSAAEIARSLKRSAQGSRRRKSTPFRSAMSMLNFYINRAGRNLSPRRRRTLNAAKDELRRLFGRKR